MLAIYRLSLLASGFVTALLFYFFYATTKYVSFEPPLVPPGLLPQWIPWFRPEIDLHLYLTGVMITGLGGILWYLVQSRIIQNTMSFYVQLAIQLYLRLVIVLVVTLYLIIVYNWTWWSQKYFGVAVFVFIIVTGLTWILDYTPKSLVHLQKRILVLFDIAVAIITSFIIIRVLAAVLFDDFRRGPLYSYLLTNDYWAFPGFGLSEFIVSSSILFVVLWIWLHPPKIDRKVRIIVKPFIDVVAVGTIFWLTKWVTMIRVDDDIELARHNMSTFIGPVADVLAGKTLLVDVPSQYGFLMIYALSAILQFLPRMYTSLALVNYWFMTVGFILLYISLRKWLGWGALAVLALLFEHYFFSTSTNIIWSTSPSFVRFGWWILVFCFLVVKDTTVLNPRLRVSIERMLVSLGLFWGFETGLYGLIAYIGYQGFDILTTQSALHQRLNLVVKMIIEVCASIVFLVGILSFLTYLRSGVWPDWSQLGQYASIYVSGFYVFPMQIAGPYIFVLSIYGVTAMLLLTKIFSANHSQRQFHSDDCIAAYIVCLGLAQFIYFTGHSNTNGNLHTISIPAMILFIWLLRKLPDFYQQIRTLPQLVWSPFLFWSSIALAGMIFAVITTAGTVTVANVLKNRRDGMQPWLDQSYREGYLTSSTAAINAYLSGREGENRRVAIVSTDVHYYLFKTRSANILSYNNNWTILMVDQIETLSQELVKLKPEIVFVDDVYHPNNEAIFSRVRSSYTLVERYGVLNKWVRSDKHL